MLVVTIALLAGVVWDYPEGRIPRSEVDRRLNVAALVYKHHAHEVWPASDKRLLELAVSKTPKMADAVIAESIIRNSRTSPTAILLAIQTNPSLELMNVIGICNAFDQFEPKVQIQILLALRKSQKEAFAQRVTAIALGLAGHQAIGPALIRELETIDTYSPLVARALGHLKFKPASSALRKAERRFLQPMGPKPYRSIEGSGGEFEFLVARANVGDSDAIKELSRRYDAGLDYQFGANALDCLAHVRPRDLLSRLRAGLTRDHFVARKALSIIAKQRLIALKSEVKAYANSTKVTHVSYGSRERKMRSYARHIVQSFSSGIAPLTPGDFLQEPRFEERGALGYERRFRGVR